MGMFLRNKISRFIIQTFSIQDTTEQRSRLLKSKKLFSPYKIIDSENFIKVSQNPNKVARDTQGLPTVPHNDFGGLNFKGLASKYLLLMTLPPADDEKMKKNRTSGTPTSEKTSDFASSSKVCRTKVKLKISETNFCKSYGPACDWRCMPDPPIIIMWP